MSKDDCISATLSLPNDTRPPVGFHYLREYWPTAQHIRTDVIKWLRLYDKIHETDLVGNYELTLTVNQEVLADSFVFPPGISTTLHLSLDLPPVQAQLQQVHIKVDGR